MRIHALKLLILWILLLLPQIMGTNAFFYDTETIPGSTFSTGCWTPPSIPIHISPSNDYRATPNSSWILNPVMDWADSTATCSISSITYQYESYYDTGLGSLAYRSDWLTTSYIPAPNTPDGVYYWRVRAKDSEGNISEFSAPWQLTVDRSISSPSPSLLSLPTNDQTSKHNQSENDSNRLQLETNLAMSLINDKHILHFELTGSGINQFTHAQYDLTYIGDEVSQSIIGSFDIEKGLNEYSKNIDLGTCSTNGTCTYPTVISQIKLKIKLTSDVIERILTQEILN